MAKSPERILRFNQGLCLLISAAGMTTHRLGVILLGIGLFAFCCWLEG
jgi:hypothetical protein